MKLSEWKPWRSSLQPSTSSSPFSSSLARDVYGLENKMLDLMRSFAADRDFALPLTSDLRMYPAIDVQETPESYAVEAELPGMTEKDIKLELRNNILSIKGEKTSEVKKGNGYIHSERCYGAFAREIPFDEEVNMDQVDAVFKNGVLRVEVKKKESSTVKRKKIEIHH
ncbi:MAG: Hsp20/alpha crystallin family protein [Bdellovibrio sp.]|nr:Hsp20/alpha crystallin family protein [Bdellovibrio sp.]